MAIYTTSPGFLDIVGKLASMIFMKCKQGNSFREGGGGVHGRKGRNKYDGAYYVDKSGKYHIYGQMNAPINANWMRHAGQFGRGWETLGRGMRKYGKWR